MTRVLTGLLADGYTYTGGGGAPEATHGDPVLGWLLIAGLVAAVVAVAWLVARIGDLDSASDKP
jgi:hypothetical protein